MIVSKISCTQFVTIISSISTCQLFTSLLGDKLAQAKFSPRTPINYWDEFTAQEHRLIEVSVEESLFMVFFRDDYNFFGEKNGNRIKSVEFATAYFQLRYPTEF